MTLSVADVIGLPLMREANVVAGHDALSDRRVRWVAVIEWPVEAFVSPGDLVLTSGVGCQSERFDRLCEQVMNSSASAIFVGTGRGRYVEAVSPAARKLADERRIPLIEIPWEMRFSEIIQAVVNSLLEDQYAIMGRAEDIHSRFTNLIIDDKGIDIVADTLESLIMRSVLIFDSEWQLQAAGSSATEALGATGLAACSEASAGLSPEQANELTERLEGCSPTDVPHLLPLGLGPGTVAAVVSKRTTLGYIYTAAVADPSVRMAAVESRAIEHAATAVALATLRTRAIAEAEARVRGDFIWSLALGLADPDEDIESRAAVLGYNPRGSYWVAVIQDPGDSSGAVAAASSPTTPDRIQRDVWAIARELGIPVITARHDALVLALLPEWMSDLQLPRRFGDLLRKRHPDVSAGLSATPAGLRGMQREYQAARRSLEIGETVMGRPFVVHADDLTPYFILDSLKADPAALSMARKVLAPLLQQDKAPNYPLLHTLEVYLDKTANTSAAARQLYLNRHSLLYRIAKIETLTGYRLDRRDDRFVLELSLRLLRIGRIEREGTEIR